MQIAMYALEHEIECNQRFPNEMEELGKLEYGFVYHAEAIDILQKVLVEKTKVLDETITNVLCIILYSLIF